MLRATTLAIALLAGGSSLAAGGCASMQHASAWSGVHRAVAVVRPTEGSGVRGVVRFEDVDGGVRVTADIDGLQPNAKHAFHIHEYGDATAPDGTSAGSHYDPGRTEHHDRANAEPPHHAGDLGNLDADASGHAHYDRVIRGVSVAGMTDPIVGRCVIIHTKADDFGQPTGNAGGRIAIGVIGIAKPE